MICRSKTSDRYCAMTSARLESPAIDPDISFIMENFNQFFVLDGARIIDAICGETVLRSMDQNLPYKLPLNGQNRVQIRCSDVRCLMPGIEAGNGFAAGILF